MRASVSCARGWSRIAQVPPRERHEHVLEGRVMRSEHRELRAAAFEQRQQRDDSRARTPPRAAASARPTACSPRTSASPRVPQAPARRPRPANRGRRSEEHTSELQSLAYLVCRLLLEKKKTKICTPAGVTSTRT